MSILDDKTEHDDVDTRPAYYGGPDDPYEPVKIIHRVGLGPGFYYGSALKYLQRVGKKASETSRDLKKARWYLANAIRLGYEIPAPLRIQEAARVTGAWHPAGSSDLLREATFYALTGCPEESVKCLDGLLQDLETT